MKKKNCNKYELRIQGLKVERFIRKLEDWKKDISHDQQYAKTEKAVW
jgi:hypothetical protein